MAKGVKQEKKPTNKPKGRPSKYKSEFKIQAYKLTLLGAIDKELADFFNVSESTLNLWKLKHPSFSESIKNGKIIADAEVVSSLNDRANGAEWTEQQAFKLKTVEYNNGKRVKETERVEVVDVMRKAPPDTTAQIFWLKNRQPLYWHDRKQVAIDLNNSKDAKELTYTELMAMIEERNLAGND